MNNYNIYPKINFLSQHLSKSQQMPQSDSDKKKQSSVKTSIFYVNDVHGKMTNMERIKTVSDIFDKSKKDENTAKLKLASGDIILGANFISNMVANKFLNWIGVTANALGNHELDVVPSKLAELMKQADYKLLAINASVDPQSPMAGRIGKSIIEEHDGQKFGIIGIAPSDMAERVKLNDSVKDIKIDDFETTLKKVQEEVNNLRSQGINKIILLSHSGLKHDKRLAQETEGVDIILGGHSHDMVKDVKDGENLLMSKAGEPVVITQAGKDGENVGVLNVEWTEDGVLTKVQNNVINTRNFNRTLPSRTAVEEIIGKPQILGNVSYADKEPPNRLIANNPHGDLIVDAMRSELGTDIAILNAGNIRGHFDVGKIDSRLVNDVTPFEDKMMIGNLSEVDIVNAIKVGAKSLTTHNSKPGILLISGMNYTMNDRGELLSLEYVDKNGNKQPIDINNPNPNRKFSCAMDDFFATGGDNYLPTNEKPDFVVAKFDLDKNKLACDYIKKFDKPIEIRDDQRVKIVKS